MWRCGGCGEENEPAFDVCWKCQAPAPETAATGNLEVPQPAAIASPQPAAVARKGGPVPLGKLLLRTLADVIIVVLLGIQAVRLVVVIAELSPSLEFALMALGELLFLGVASWRLYESRRAGEPLLPIRGGSTGIAVAAGLGAGAAIFGLGLLYVFALGPLLKDVQPAFDEEVFGSLWQALATLVIVVVMAPVCEEFFFRGAMFATYAGSGRPRLGYAISAALFAIAHLKPPMTPLYLAMGLAMAWLFARTRSIVAPIVAHAVNNAAVLALPFFFKT